MSVPIVKMNIKNTSIIKYRLGMCEQKRGWLAGPEANTYEADSIYSWIQDLMLSALECEYTLNVHAQVLEELGTAA